MQKVPGLTALQRFGQQTARPIGSRAQAPDASGLKPAALQPQAQPVDTYSRPERPPEGNSLLQLADTLGAINPALQRFSQAMQPKPADSEAAMRAYLQKTPKQEVLKAFESGQPPKEAQTLEGMRVLGEDLGFRDGQAFIQRYNSPDFDKATGDTDQLWREVQAETVKRFGNDRAFMEVYTKAAEDVRRKVMTSNMDYKTQEEATARADTNFGAWEGRVATMIDNGDEPDKIAASLFGDIEKNRQFLGLHPKDQQKQLLQIADRYATRGQFDVARSILGFERQNGAYKGSLISDRELGGQATDLLARIQKDEMEFQSEAAAKAAEEGAYKAAMKASDIGAVNSITDVTVKDRKGEDKVISAETLRKEVARRTIDTISVEAKRRGMTPEQAKKLEKERFIGNGLEHPQWFQTINSVPGQISLNAVSGKIAPNALDAYQLYKELNAEAPQYLGKYTDQKAIDFFEQARAMEETGIVDSPNDALLAAFTATTQIAAPEVLKLRDDDLQSAVDAATSDGWLFDSETGNRGYVQQEIARQARILSRTGLAGKDALDRAKEAFTKTHINIAGTWMKNDKRLPTDFATLAQEYLDQIAAKYADELHIDADDITLDRMGNGTGSWIVLWRGIRQPLNVPNADRIVTLKTLDSLRSANRKKAEDTVIKNQNAR